MLAERLMSGGAAKTVCGQLWWRSGRQSAVRCGRDFVAPAYSCVCDWDVAVGVGVGGSSWDGAAVSRAGVTFSRSLDEFNGSIHRHSP